MEEEEVKPNYGLTDQAQGQPSEAKIKSESMKQLQEFKQQLLRQKRI